MLSNPTNNLQNRQRQHRRQNSTPTAFEAAKVPNLQNLQRHNSHRRGISLDQRRRQTPPQELRVSNTNQGYQTTQQHILRETQQQRLVRPGHQYQNYDNDENYRSPAVTPHRQSFDAGCMSTFQGQRTMSPYPYTGPVNDLMSVDSSNFNGGNDFNMYVSDGNMTPSAFLDFSNFDMSNSGSANSSKRSSRRISGGILDRVAQFENMAMKSERPVTPPTQNATGYFPLTPADTPFDRLSKHDQRRLFNSFDESTNGTIKPRSNRSSRFIETYEYDGEMEETIKPKSTPRARGVFEEMRAAAENISIPSPSGSAQPPNMNNFDSAPMPTANFMNMANLHMGLDFDGSQYSPTSSNMSPSLSYHSEMEEMSQMPSFVDPFTNKPTLDAPGMHYNSGGLPTLPVPSSPVHTSPHRRSESVNSFNLEETITETGITIDDIATFIQGPDPVDNKWLCLYPECNKRFGRKENIKSHVQTHLGDRQFQCPHCQKCFVRQHDLKRHAKIHSGVKPYPCQCGNSFARHDALTRHRQRGMCIGAFEGVVKKVVKRGRPKKNRPDVEERVKKSSRTRSKNKDKTMSSGSSTSGASEASYGQSPPADIDILDDKPFGDFNEFSQESTTNYQYSQAHSPQPTNCVSPHDVEATQSAHSPSAYSTHSHLSRRDSATSHAASPTKSYHSPPGLCDSSSSPAASNQFYDVDSTSNHGDEMQLTNISEQDEDMFLEAFATNNNGNALTQLERDPDLLMSKFEDTYGNASGEDLFQNNGEDMFFGSP